MTSEKDVREKQEKRVCGTVMKKCVFLQAVFSFVVVVVVVWTRPGTLSVSLVRAGPSSPVSVVTDSRTPE